MKVDNIERLKGVCEALYHTHYDIEDEKDFTIDVFERIGCYFVELSYIKSFRPAIFKGSRLQPADDDIKILDIQTVYVSKDTNISKVVKDIEAEIERIFEAKCPELEFD